MAKGKKTGGRVRGSITKDRAMLLEKAKELGVDVFEILLRFAAGDYAGLNMSPTRVIGKTQRGDDIVVDSISPELRQKSAKDAAQYVLPQLKAIEVDDKAKDVAAVVYVAQWGSKIEPSDDTDTDA